MFIAMTGDLMTGSGNFSNQPRIPPSHLADDKKCRPHTPTCERVKVFFGVVRNNLMIAVAIFHPVPDILQIDSQKNGTHCSPANS